MQPGSASASASDGPPRFDPAKLLALVAWPAAWQLYPPLLLAFTPGLALLPARRDGDDAAVRGIQAIGASLCFWSAGFWLLRWVPVAIDDAFLVVSAASTLLFVARPATPAPWRDRLARIPLGAWLAAGAVVWLRLLPMNGNPVPPGADMSMHTYLTELIVRAEGLPASYRPILPIDSFGTFPVGFHVHAAIVALTTEAPSYRAAFLVSAWSHALTTLALYVVGRRFAGAAMAGLVAFLASFATHAPQGFLGWGGNPTVLAIALAALTFESLLRFRTWRPADAALAALFVAGVATVHTLVLVQSFYLMGLPLLGWLVWRGPRTGETVRGLAIFAAVLAALIAPYAVGIDPGVLDEETLAWIANWVRNTNHVWQAHTWTAPITIPAYVVHYVGEGVLALAPFVVLGLVAVRRRDPMAWALALAFFAVAFLLILNARFWWLPLSPLIYPERVASMLLIPLVGLAGAGLGTFLEGFANPRRAAAVALACVVVFSWSPFERRYRVLPARHASVRSADLRALGWLDERAEPGDVIVTQPGDAGIWIPALLFRPVTRAHVNITHLTRVEMPEDGRFLYLGSRCVYGCEWSLEEPPDPARWREIHADGAARIYERVPGPAPVSSP